MSYQADPEEFLGESYTNVQPYELAKYKELSALAQDFEALVKKIPEINETMSSRQMQLVVFTDRDFEPTRFYKLSAGVNYLCAVISHAAYPVFCDHIIVQTDHIVGVDSVKKLGVEINGRCELISARDSLPEVFEKRRRHILNVLVRAKQGSVIEL